MADEIKVLPIRIPKEMWLFLKRHAIEKEQSMNEIILDCIGRYQMKEEKKQQKRLSKKLSGDVDTY